MSSLNASVPCIRSLPSYCTIPGKRSKKILIQIIPIFAGINKNMGELEKIRKPVKQELTEFEKVFRKELKGSIPFLDIITNFILRRKGKQIRPLFVFLSAKLFGQVNQSTYVAASLIELLHTATLVHDDVVDESYERRGFFSLNALWKSKVAVLVGDYLLAKGLLAAVRHKEYHLLEIVSDAVREMSEGELLQIQKSRRNGIAPEEYFEIIRKKTAALISSCTACGAYSAGASEESIERMKQFGEHAGIIFQIKDDLLDYQKTGLTGKPTGNDIREGKYTLPLILALQHSPAGEAREIRRMMRRKDLKKKDVNKVIEFAGRYGGISQATEKMNEYIKTALLLLEDFPANEAREALSDLLYFIASREN